MQTIDKQRKTSTMNKNLKSSKIWNSATRDEFYTTEKTAI